MYLIRPVDALAIPSLGRDQLLLDNATTMARFGAVLDRKRQCFDCLSSKSSIPAVQRLSSPKFVDTVHTSVAAVSSDSTES